MDTYPAFEQAEGTESKYRAGMLARTASNGQTRMRALASQLRADPQIVHLALTPAQWATLKAFHEAHRGVAFDVELWDEDVTITAYFADPPFQRHTFATPGGLRHHVTVNLIQQ